MGVKATTVRSITVENDLVKFMLPAMISCTLFGSQFIRLNEKLSQLDGLLPVGMK